MQHPRAGHRALPRSRRRTTPIERAVGQTVERLEARRMLTSVTSVVFDYDTAPHKLHVTFSDAIDPATLGSGDAIVEAIGKDARVAASRFAISLDAAHTEATFTLNGNFANGDYSVRILRDDIHNAAGDPLATDAASSFFFRNGDATGPTGTRDRSSDAFDEALVGSHLGLSTGATFSLGDFNYDGVVDESDYDWIDGATMSPPIDGVSRLTATPVNAGHAVELNWGRISTTATGFVVQRSDDDGRSFVTLANALPLTTLSFVDSTVTLGTQSEHIYRVRTLEGRNILTGLTATPRYAATTLRYNANAPASPSSVQPPSDVQPAAGKNSIALTWTDVSADDDGVEVFRSANGVDYVPVDHVDVPRVTTWTDTNLRSGTSYWYKLRAFNATLTSTSSTPVTATTLGGAPAVIAGVVEAFGDGSQRLSAEFDQPIFAAVNPLDASRVSVYALDAGRSFVGGSDFVVDGISGDGRRLRLQILGLKNADINKPGYLANGNYEITISGDAVRNAAGDTIADANNPDVEGIGVGYFLRCDFDNNRQVDFGDLLILARNYGTTGKSYADGDSDFNGTVDFTDLLALARSYQTRLDPPPSAPNQLTVSTALVTNPSVDSTGTADPSNSAYLQWSAPDPTSTPYDGFRIWRSADGVNFTPIADVSTSTFGYLDRGLAQGTKYTYRVRPYRNSGAVGRTTNKATVVTTLPGPTNLVATAVGSDSIHLDWVDRSIGETDFLIELLNRDGDVVKTLTAPADSTSADIDGLAPGTAYTIQLSARTAAASGRAIPEDLSGGVEPTVVTGLATVPTLTATLLHRRTALLAWTGPAPDQHIEVQRSVDGGSTWMSIPTPPSSTSFDDGGLPAASTVEYRARIVGAAGSVGAWCAARSVLTGTGNDAPVATDGTLYVRPGRTITLTADGVFGRLASDVDGDPLTYDVVQYLGSGTLSVTPAGALTYSAPRGVGSEHFTYRVNDGSLTSELATVTIEIDDAPPVPRSLTYAGHRGAGLTVNDPTLGLLAFAIDADDDEMTATLVTQAASGTVVVHADGTFAYVPNDASVTSDTFTYQVTAAGQVASATVTIELGNAPPPAVDTSFQVAVGQTLIFPASAGLLATVRDPDGDPLTVTSLVQPPNATLDWHADGSFTLTPMGDVGSDSDFFYTVFDGIESTQVEGHLRVTAGSGRAIDDEYETDQNATLSVDTAHGLLINDGGYVGPSRGLSIVANTQPDHGSVSLNADGSFTYFPPLDFTGQASFTYDLQDATGGISRATVSIDVADTAPVTVGDVYSVGGGQTLNVSAALGVLNNDLDVHGRPLRARLVDRPSVGVLSLNDDGSFVYVAPDGAGRTVRFTYEALDAAGAPSRVTPVNIDIDDSSIVGVSDVYTVASRGTTAFAATAGVLSNDSIAGDPAAVVAAELVSAPAHGSLSLNADGSFAYTADGRANDVERFTYRIVRNGLANEPIEVALRLRNTAPIATDDAFTATEDQTLSSGNVLANDSDPDGDTLSLRLARGTAHGSLDLHSDGTFTYTPDANYVGTDEFLYEIGDGAGYALGRAMLTVAPVNDAPRVILPGGRASVSRHAVLTGTLAAGVSDADAGDVLTFALAAGSTSRGTVTLSTDGTFKYVPDPTQLGDDSFDVVVTDRAGASVAFSVLIAVTNAAPAAADRSYAVTQGQPLTVSPSGGLLGGRRFDDDSDPITASLLSGPAAGSVIVQPDGSFTFFPASGQSGTVQFAYAVSDGLTSSTATATIEIATAALRPRADTVYVHHLDSIVLGTRPSVLANDRAFAGQSLSVVDHTDAALGTLQFQSDGRYSYVPRAGASGTDAIQYTVSDGTTQTTAWLYVNVSNANVYARSDQYDVPHDRALTVPNALGVLANDFDLDAQDRANWTLSLVAGPSADAFTLTPDGGFTYVPPAGFVGTQTFTYQISDGERIAQADVTLNVKDAAASNAERAFRLHAGGTLSVDLSSGMTDLENDEQSFEAQGTLPTGLSLSQDGELDYAPPSAFVGDVSFSYRTRSTKTGVLSDATAVRITVWNALPEVASIHFSTHTAKPLNDTLAQYLTSADSDTDDWIFEPAGSSGGVAAGGSSPLKSSANNDVTLRADGSFAYTSRSDYRGSDTFSVQVFDGHQRSATITVTVDVENASPIAVSDVFQTKHGHALSANVLTGQTTGADGEGPADVDGDQPGDALHIADWREPGHGTFTHEPDGSFTYTPDHDFAGQVSVGYLLSDGTSTSEWASATIDVTNAKPIAMRDDELFPIDSGPHQIAVLANDLDADDQASLTVLPLQDMPAPGTLTLANNILTFTPAAGQSGDVTFSYRLTDGVDTVTGQVGIDITDNGLNAENDTFLIDGKSAQGDVSANDHIDPSRTGTRFQVVQGVNKGTLALDGQTGHFTYTQRADASGGDSFTYKLSGTTREEMATVYLDTRIKPPTAVNDTITRQTGQTTLTIPISAITSNDTVQTGALGDARTVIVHQPVGGGLTFDASTNTYSYTPGPLAGSVDVFTYKLIDKDGVPSNSASVRLDLGDGRTVIAQDDVATVAANHDVTVSVLANDHTPGGAAVSDGNIEIIDVPDSGTAAVFGHTIKYTAPLDAGFGADQVTYRVTLPNGAQATAALIITEAAPARALQVLHGGVLHVDEDSSASMAVVTAGTPKRIAITGQTRFGSALVNDAGVITYTPRPDVNSDLPEGGTDTVAFTAIDQDLNVYTGSIDVQIADVNDVPILETGWEQLSQTATGPHSLRVDLHDFIHDTDGDAGQISNVVDTLSADDRLAVNYTVSGTTVIVNFGTDAQHPERGHSLQLSFALTDGRGGSKSYSIGLSDPGSSPPADPLPAASQTVNAAGNLSGGRTYVGIAPDSVPVSVAIDASGNVTLSKAGTGHAGASVFLQDDHLTVTWADADASDALYVSGPVVGAISTGATLGTVARVFDGPIHSAGLSLNGNGALAIVNGAITTSGDTAITAYRVSGAINAGNLQSLDTTYLNADVKAHQIGIVHVVDGLRDTITSDTSINQVSVLGYLEQVRNFASMSGSARIVANGGDIGSVTIAGDINQPTGNAIEASGSIGNVTSLNGSIDAGIVAHGGSIANATASIGITGSLHASGDLVNVAARWLDVDLTSDGGRIGWATADRGDADLIIHAATVGQLTSGGTMTLQAVADAAIDSITAGMDLTGRATAGGNLGDTRAGGNMALDISAASVYALTAGLDFTGSVTIAGQSGTITVGRKLDSPNITIGGELASLLVGNTDLRHTSSLSVLNLTAASIGTLSVRSAHGFPADLKASVITKLGGVDHLIVDGAVTNTAIRSAGPIQDIAIGANAQLDASAVGPIGPVKIAGGLDGSLSATGTIGGYLPGIIRVIVIGGDVNGTIAGTTGVANVTIGGDLQGGITSTADSVGSITVGGQIDAKLLAHVDLGSIAAGGSIAGSITAENGNVGDLTAGTAGNGGDISAEIHAEHGALGAVLALGTDNTNEALQPTKGEDVVASSDIARQSSLLGPKPETPGITDLDPGAGGQITGAITARSIGRIAAHGDLKSTIDADTLGSLWVLGDLASTLTLHAGGLTADVWGDLSEQAKVTVKGDLELHVGQKSAGTLTSAAGNVTLDSWDEVSADVHAAAESTFWTAKKFMASVTAHDASVQAFGNIEVSKWSVDFSSIMSTAGDWIMNGKDNVARMIVYAFADASGTLHINDGYCWFFTEGTARNLTVESTAGEPIDNGTLVLAKGGVTNSTFNVAGRLSISSLGDISNVSINNTAAKTLTEVMVEGANLTNVSVSGNVEAVDLNASGDVTTGNVTAYDTVHVSASKGVTGSYKSIQRKTPTGQIDTSTPSGGIVNIEAMAAVTGDYDGIAGASITTFGTVSAAIKSEKGPVAVDTQGSITLNGTVTGESVDIKTWSGLGQATINGKQTASIDDYSGNDVNLDVTAGKKVAIESHGGVAGTITAGAGLEIKAFGDVGGTLTSGWVDPNAYVDADHADQDLIIATHGAIASDAVLTAGRDINITAGETLQTAIITSGRDVDVIADTIDHSTITAKHGTLTVEPLTSIGQSTLSGDAGVTLLTGTIDGLTVLAAFNVTTDIEASEAINGTLTIKADYGKVEIVSGGGDTTLAIGPIGTQPPPFNVDIQSKGKVAGDIHAKLGITVASTDALALGTVTTDDPTSEISLFGQNGVKVTSETSAGTLSVNTAGKIEGALNAAHGLRASGDVMAAALGSSGGDVSVVAQTDVTGSVQAHGTASVVAGRSIAGGSIIGGSVDVSCAGTGDTGQVASLIKSTTGDAAVRAAGAVSSAVHAWANLTLAAGGIVSGQIDSDEGDISVTTTRSVTGAVTAHRNLELLADSLTGDVKATVGDASVTIEKNVASTITAGGEASLITHGDLAGAGVVTGRSASAIVRGDVAGHVTASLGDLSVNAGGTFDGVASAAHGTASVTSLGDFDGSVSAADASVVTYGVAEGTIDASHNASLQSVGDVAGTVTASNDASIDTLGAFTGQLNTTTGNATISTMHGLSGPVTAGHDAIVSIGTDAAMSAHITAAHDLTADLTGDFTGEFDTAEGDIRLSVGGPASGTLHSANDAFVDATGEINSMTLVAGASATINGLLDMLNLVVTAADDVTVNGQAQVGTLTASSADGDVTIASVGDLSGTVDAPAGGVDLSSLAGMTMSTVVAHHDIAAEAGGDLGGQFTSDGAVSLTALGTLDALIDAVDDVSLTSRGLLSAVATSSDGSIGAVSGDEADLSVDGANDVSVIAVGKVVGSVSAQGSVSAVAGTDLDGDWTAGDGANLLAMGWLNANVAASGDVSLFGALGVGHTGVSSPVIRAGTLSIGSDASIESVDAQASDKISLIRARGNVDGTFETAGDLDQVMVYGAVGAAGASATFSVGHDVNTFDVWGDLDAQVTAGNRIVEMTAGGSVMRTPTAGSDEYVAGDDPNVANGEWPADYKLTWGEPFDPLPWSLTRVQAELNDAYRAITLAGQQAVAGRADAAKQATTAAVTAGESAAAAVEQMLSEELPRSVALIDVQTRAIGLALDEATTSIDTSAKEVAQSLLASLGELKSSATSMGTALTIGLSDLRDALGGAKASLAERFAFEDAVSDAMRVGRAAAVEAAFTKTATGDANRANDWERKAKASLDQIKQAIADHNEQQHQTLANFQKVLSLIRGFVGWIPGADVVLGLTDATIWLIRGNGAEAAVSFIDAIPFGKLASLALKGATGLYRSMQAAQTELKILNEARELCMAGRAALRFGAVGAFIAKTLNLTCFVAGTQVVTGIADDGSLITRNIEDLRTGDTVLARDQYDESDDVQSETLTDVYRRTSTHLRFLTVRDGAGNEEVIQTTDEHPFYVEEIGWTSAGDLLPGMRLSELDGSNDSTIVATRREEHPEGIAVFNLEVAGDHTYFIADGVTGDAVWVHNNYNGATSAALYGMVKHAEYYEQMAKKGFETNMAIGKSLLRPDAWKVIIKNGKAIGVVIRELKPHNPRAISRGLKQLEAYTATIKNEFPRLRNLPFDAKVVTYIRP